MTNAGFYRVFKTSPTARADFLSTQRDSGTNQLNILDNDLDPDDDVFLIASVTSASHGSIGYTATGSTFLYTPDSGFFGMDSFTYTITNLTGGRATATVSVFVNQTGNQAPSVSHPIVTLPTNIYATTLTATAGASDPDGDAISFVAATTPLWGAVAYASGQLAYSHPSNYFGNDTFDYYLTDGRGGLSRVSVSILEADADGDSMADEWEMLFGLNPLSNDAQGDPDGDGLPNLAEFKLATDPRYADNPLHLDEIATGQAVSEYGRIPLALNSRIPKLPVSLLMNGNIADASFQQGADGGWYFRWDTGYLTNGNYSIATSFQFDPDAQLPTPGRATSLEKTVRVTNEVIFDRINSEFSDIWFIDLTFAYTPAEWRIELYDEDGSGLVYFDGTSTSGKVQGGWDLTAGGGQISFGNILAYVYAAPAGQSLPALGDRAAAKGKRWFTKQIPGGIGDKFVVAWGWDAYGSGFNQRRENLMLDGVINIIGNPGLDDEYLLLPAANIPFGGAFRFDDDTDKQLLKLALKSPEAGNFFWFGHGASDAIQGNAKKATIDAGEIEQLLENKKHRSKPPLYSYNNRHPYRLVILNGCDTYSPDWANAFGFDFSPAGTTNDVLAYIRQGRQPQAFVGWKEAVEVPPNFDSTGHARYATALAYLFSNWMEGYLLEEGLRQYADYLFVLGYKGHRSWSVSGSASLFRSAP